jgi:hypothetical protein
MINVIQEIKQQSRLFNEPPPPAPTNADLVREMDEAIEMAATLKFELHRLENRLVLLRSRIEGTEVGK